MFTREYVWVKDIEIICLPIAQLVKTLVRVCKKRYQPKLFPKRPLNQDSFAKRILSYHNS